MIRRRTASFLLILTLAAPATALARDPQPQFSEFSAQVDTWFGSRPANAPLGTPGANGSTIDLTYSRTFSPIDRRDEVVPILRRFVRTPSELFVRFHREGRTTEASTMFSVGGLGYLAGGRAYGRLELGIDHVNVLNEALDFESAYLGALVDVELGGRPTPLLSLGAYGVLQPVIKPLPERGDMMMDIEREGHVLETGLAFALATGNDRVFVKARLGYRMVDWNFVGFVAHQMGTLTANGPAARVETAFQLDNRQSVVLTVWGHYDDWENARDQDLDGDGDFDGTVTDSVFGVQGDLNYLFWFEGRWGFRVALGGGYEEKPPVFGALSGPQVHLGVGFVNRW